MNSHKSFTVPKLQNILDSGRLLCYSENYSVCFKNIIAYFLAYFSAVHTPPFFSAFPPQAILALDIAAQFHTKASAGSLKTEFNLTHSFVLTSKYVREEL